MRILALTNFISCIALVVAFLLGFYIRDIGFGEQGTKPIKNVETKPLATIDIQNKKQETVAINPDITKLIQENAYLTANCNSVNTPAQDLGLPDFSNQSKSATELLATLETLLAQKKTVEELQADNALQQLMVLMQTNPAAQKLVAERFLEAAGTPLGDVLSTALVSSGGGAEVNAVAVQLLRDGTPQQRVGALSMLGQVGGTQDASTRAMVLDILQNDSGADDQLTLAALSTLNRQGIVSIAEQQNVIETVTPYLHAQDPKLRQTSTLTALH
jgi:hypothetical protein